ncbi:hypothetical protein C8P68_1172 [Mucilaginibacter yixingensis]|uniref:Uncharacterized protein n=1 Tax=Mucilaginibacter yixingensis TaxID=1295612 RepID=A0A2T5J4H5_9SPHI|nr:hypothetical protein C8P68_1172 [Mucilaginibacter yixingensis]
MPEPRAGLPLAALIRNRQPGESGSLTFRKSPQPPYSHDLQKYRPV